MKTRHAALLTTGLVTLIGCSSYIKQPTVCIDRWYGYVQEGGCPSAVKAAAVDETAARLAALERERQRLADELDAARRQNGTLSSRVSDLERQLADRDRELSALRSGSGDRDRLASQLTSAQGDRDRLAAELAAANQRIADLERQLAEARAAQAAPPPAPKLESARQGLVRALRPQIAKGDISIDLNSERLLINLASNYLFGSGQDQLKPGGVEALKKVGEVLKDYPEYSVSVSGHTDNRPLRSTLKKKFASNQELSEARAASAAKALTEGGLTSVTTTGHADTQPVASNDTEAGRAQNRRVEIIVK
ncbi:MAG: OmpA family protein [Nitrospira sp.]|nr:OmpA family protein [Nitrospira sp.]